MASGPGLIAVLASMTMVEKRKEIVGKPKEFKTERTLFVKDNKRVIERFSDSLGGLSSFIGGCFNVFSLDGKILLGIGFRPGVEVKFFLDTISMKFPGRNGWLTAEPSLEVLEIRGISGELIERNPHYCESCLALSARIISTISADREKIINVFCDCGFRAGIKTKNNGIVEIVR